MENGWNLFNFNTASTTSFGRVHNSSNCTTTTTAWDISESGTSITARIDWSNGSSSINPHNSLTSSRASTTTVSSSVTATNEKSPAVVPTIMVAHEGNHHHHLHYSNSSDPLRLYSAEGGGGGGGGTNFFPDPHLTCLKLGKRHYFGDAIATPLGDQQASPPYSIITKKGKPYYESGGDAGLLDPSTSVGVTAPSSNAVPRCQVDGCNVVLLNAKDYHRRHKVCEIHSKAPKVVVLGLEQRFCQQCSRFHAVSEFDESKRSCRRRLAGHNERRRKSSQEHSGNRNQAQANTRLMTYPGRHTYLPMKGACALSLLSSSKNDSWISATDLPARCSAALRELIAENRAAILARQLILDKDWHWHHHPGEDLNGRQSESLNNYPHQQQMATGSGSHSWERMGEETHAHVTLDLMQAPNSAFGFFSMRGKSKEDDQDCPELWSSFGGAHVV